MPKMAYNPPMLRSIARFLVPVLVITAAPAAQAALFPPLKQPAARKRPTIRDVANAAGLRPTPRPTPRATARPTPRPTPHPTPAPTLSPVSGPAAEPTPAADPTPEVVHPALRVSAWRPTRTGALYGQALEADASLWQGDWGLGARVVSFGGVAPSPPFAVGGVLPTFSLRRRFGAAEAGGSRLECELGYLPTGPAPGLGLAGVEAHLPLRRGWLAIEAGLRAARGPLNAPWLLDGRLGLMGRLGPAQAGLGWRHLALGWDGASRSAGFVEQFTGPYVAAGLAF